MAKTDVSRRSIGTDGKLYRLMDEKDQYKFRLSSEDDEQLVRQKAQTIANTLRRRNSESSPTKGKTARFGSASRSQRMEQSKWNAAFNKAAKEKTDTAASSSGFVKRSASVERPASATTITETVKAKVEPAMSEIFNVFQHKYEKNLQVIETLFHEKQEMKHRIEELERQLTAENIRLEGTEHQTDLGSSMPELKDAGETFTPSMAAALFTEDQATPVPEPKASEERGREKSSAARSVRSHSAEPTRGESMEKASAPKRSQSIDRASRVSLTSRPGQFTIQMQASIDNYIQKRVLIERKEQEAQLEQLAYEQKQRERFLRVRITLLLCH